MKRILITNDDGMNATGIRTLQDALSKLGEVYIVAPDREQSACSHTLTLKRPLRAKKLGENKYSINGTPTDAIFLALNGLFKGVRFDLVASGINSGSNMAQNLSYSGTVGAAMEGTLNNVPSFAISLDGLNDYNWETGGSWAKRIAAFIFEKGLSPGVMLNVNVPNIPLDQVKGFQITRQGRYIHSTEVVESTDPRGNKYYWIGGQELGFEPVKGSDLIAVENNNVSITPVHLDMTDYDKLNELLGQEF